MADLMNAFQIGQGIGKANAFPGAEASGNILDVFNRQMQMQAQYQAQRGLQENAQQLQSQYEPARKQQETQQEQQTLNQYEPQRKGAELQQELQARGNYMGNIFKQLGINPGGGDQSDSQDASTQDQNGTGVKSKNPLHNASKGGYMVKSLDPMSGKIELGNTGYDAAQKQAEVGPQVEGDQLKSSASDANSAALMMQKLDEIRGLHDKALSSMGVNRASVQPNDVFGLGTRLSQANQSGQLALQGPSNPDWQNYEKAKKNFSFAADRGLFGEKGKLIGQQLDAGVQMFPDASGTKQGDQGLWKTLYSVPQKSIDFHNQLVDQYNADPSMKIQSNSKYQQADALREDADSAIQKGANGKKVAERFKAMTGMDY